MSQTIVFRRYPEITQVIPQSIYLITIYISRITRFFRQIGTTFNIFQMYWIPFIGEKCIVTSRYVRQFNDAYKISTTL